MARYRVNDKYLSEEEYADHLDSRRAGAFGLIGLLLGGIGAYLLLRDFDLPKIASFGVIVGAAVICCKLFVYARNVLATLLSAAIALLALWFVGGLIWQAL